ncbi:MAG: sigma-54-dependent Fis family transcriptional regulator [Deltaproteobacteria bacterium]|nr:sigma-54-dependent Fis family transcriptional regulator [Deltaproteobacteria bacterium]HCH64382.1 sigma-54-dependent Fis family transcriptional regulator [Deltaproteobacteria bacterium]
MAGAPTVGERLRVLARIAGRVSTSDDLERVLGPVLRDVGEGTGLQRVSLGIVEPAGNQVVLEAGHGLTPAEVRRGRYRLGDGIIGRALLSDDATETPVVVRSIRKDPHFLDRTGALDAGVDRGLVVVPIFAEGSPVGALSAYRRVVDVHALAEDGRMLKIVGAMLRSAIVRTRMLRKGEPDRAERPPNILGRSSSMREVFGLVGQVASGPTTVLVTGESGTGKELIAEAIHRSSDRRTQPFIAVNCAAIPEGVIESELFGHERGAFTGALTQRKGRFELAHRGTLMLDEVGDLSPANQIKLLRVLQERQFERLGGNTVVKIDVRVIAATSRDLDQMVKSGSFRADLYYRLAVFPIRLPPLRERTGDITLLTNHFVEKFNRAHGRSVQRVSTNAIDMLVSYHWPGNVRELENCIERAVLLSRDDVLQGHHFPPTLQTADATNTRPAGNLKARLAAFEREIILDALKANQGNRAAAARELGLTERIMGLRVEKYGIDARRFRQGRAG